MSTDIITPGLIPLIKERLNYPLPGKAAQEKMLTRPKRPVTVSYTHLTLPTKA